MNTLAVELDCAGDGGFALSVALQFPPAGVCAIYGPSGAGKSTLLDCIAGLRRGDGGSSVRFGDDTWQGPGTWCPPWRRGIGYVFQDARLFPHLDVRGNLLYAMSRRGRDGGPSLEEASGWLELGELLSRSPASLSAGQRQRVAIARALLAAPQLLLLDEPLANLDHHARQAVLRCLRRVQSALALPILFVSHDIEDVSQLADYLVLLEAGRVVGQGPLLEMCSRLDTRLSREEQAAAIVTARVARHDAGYGLSELDLQGHPLFVAQLPQEPGGTRRVRIPARDVSICRQRPGDSSILNIFPVRVDAVEESTQARILLRLALGEQYLLARITRKSAVELALAPGQQVYAQVKSVALLMEATPA